MRRASRTVKLPPTRSSPSTDWIRFAVCAVIVVLIWIVFGQTLGHDFVNYDDKTYVYGNPLVSPGLSGRGLAKAFVDVQTNNWHPLALISHMIDCQVFGLKAGGHHFTNVLLHSIAAVLLFIWLSGVTGSFWRSGFVTALFAIHPLRVESVAWIAERKDVLSAVFFFLTLLAYARYVKALAPGRYLTMSILFACGLMSKPMLVTTPVVLLLLDYWPFNRLRDLKSLWRLTLEKVPLFVVSIASSLTALALQVQSPSSVGQLPFAWRLENAIVSYFIYIWQLFWPAKLAVFYPHPDDRLVLWQVALAVAFLVAVTLLVFKLRQSRPYLLVGWLWYLIMLLPVIGIVEVGLQGHADRYTYLPHIGLCIALTWLIVDPFPESWRRQQVLGAAGTFALFVLALLAWKQTTYWKNSETLWTHTLAVTSNNDVALTNIGVLLRERGQWDEALSYFQRALAVRSSSEHRHYSLSLALINDNVGEVLAHKGRLDEASDSFRQAIELRPDFPDAHYNLGVLLLQKGDNAGAISQLQTALSNQPNDSGTNTTLANALVQKGLLREAADHYQKALELDPESQLALNNLAWLLAAGPNDSLRDGARATDLALKLNRVTQQNNPLYVRTLAAAYAEAGEFEKAVETGQKASELALAQGQRSFAAQIQEETDRYRQRRPMRDQALQNAQ
jgi:tetratricopeptide (TPR) repeat protein